MLNSRDISLLRPDVAANCRLFLARCREAGWPVLVTGTVRDEAYQMWCYQNGTSRSKRPTFHSVKAGLAFDICKNVRGEEYSDPAFWTAVGAIGKEMGFTWGGDWKTFVDRPHFQWDGGGAYTNSMVLAGQYPPDMPLFEEDENMTDETFHKLMVRWLAAQGELEPADWSREAREKVEQAGLVAGDKLGNKRYKSLLTREEAAVMLARLLELLER